jgi:hypothetical protein
MRAAVIATAFLLFGLAVATADSPQHVLPAGTAVVFVSDGHLDAGARPGSTVAVHLRDPLVLDSVIVAPAGSKALLLVVEPGARRALSLERFSVNAGLMPVRLADPDIRTVETGTAFEAHTLAVVEHLGDRFSVRVPFPFKLSTDRPAAYYTPTPARTASPGSLIPRHRGPSPSPTAVPSPAATTDAAAGIQPSPAATKIP